MNEWQAHFTAALEAIQASRALAEVGQAVPAAFFACHAFEMAGSAYVVHIGEEPSPSHSGRCLQFAAVAHRYGVGHGVEVVAYQVGPLRNQCLYARETGEEEWAAPSQLVDQEHARDLVRRVDGIIEIVDRELPK